MPTQKVISRPASRLSPLLCLPQRNLKSVGKERVSTSKAGGWQVATAAFEAAVIGGSTGGRQISVEYDKVFKGLGYPVTMGRCVNLGWKGIECSHLSQRPLSSLC